MGSEMCIRDRYGAIELAPLDVALHLEMGGWSLSVPRAVLVLCFVLLLNIGFVVLFFKELRLVSFDQGFSLAQGMPVAALHYGLMALVAVTTVSAFEVVGSILVIAMLIVPPSAASLLSKSLPSMVLLSILVAIVSAALGHVIALFVPGWLGFESTSTSGMIAFVSGILFLSALLFALFCKEPIRRFKKYRIS